MDKKKTEYAIISNAVDILSVQCSGNRDKIIDLLTGYLWDEEEAGGIKESTGKWKFEIETPLLDQLESGPWPKFVKDMKKQNKKCTCGEIPGSNWCEKCQGFFGGFRK